MKNRKKKKAGCSCFEAIRPIDRNPLKHLLRMGRDIKCMYQRIKYGYCFRDIWDINRWFLDVVPNMLEELKEETCAYPIGPDDFSQTAGTIDEDDSNERYEAGLQKWKDTLSEMIFLLREANEETCTRENPYGAEYDKAVDEFTKKFGWFGEGLKTKEEKREEDRRGFYTLYTPSDVPEYKKISKLYFDEEAVLHEYRNSCKDKGLELFKKWFWNLWD